MLDRNRNTKEAVWNPKWYCSCFDWGLRFQWLAVFLQSVLKMIDLRYHMHSIPLQTFATWTFTAIAACRQHWNGKVFTRTRHKKLWETEHAAHACVDLGLQSTCSRPLSEPFRVLALQIIGGSWFSSLASICGIFLYCHRRLSLSLGEFLWIAPRVPMTDSQVSSTLRAGHVWEWGESSRYYWYLSSVHMQTRSSSFIYLIIHLSWWLWTSHWKPSHFPWSV